MLKRKISGPTRSRRGDEFIARGFSVHETCRRQGLELWAYLQRAIVAWIDKVRIPAWCPAQSYGLIWLSLAHRRPTRVVLHHKPSAAGRGRGIPHRLYQFALACSGWRHAAALVGGADDRKSLEQLCRYITRPALANERAQCNADGQVVLKLKTPWHDGTTYLVMSPLEFMRRLAALKPRPSLHSRPPRSRRSTTTLGHRIVRPGAPL